MTHRELESGWLPRSARGRLSAVLLMAIIPLLLCGCRPSTPVGPAPSTTSSPSPFKVPKVTVPANESEPPLSPDQVPQLVDVHTAARIEHVYQNGAEGQSLMVEALGGGAAWIDFDGDQHWDLYLTQGGQPAAADRSGQPGDRLFRNRGDGTFEEVTVAANIEQRQYGQGAAVGDFDNDGFDDIYITNVGPNVLLQNQGDGTFVEVTVRAQVGNPLWSSSAAWADIDLDGDLDLYVCNYALYDPLDPKPCLSPEGERRICHPSNVDPAPDEFYLNLGDGTFRAEAQLRGLFGPENRALGVAVADFNNDGLPDLYVANDTTENFLFVNQGEGQFVERAALLGCHVDRQGNRQASMGLAIGDFDDNGFLDIYSSHYQLESNTLYANRGPRGFKDVTGDMGLHDPTMPVLGFGTIMHDLNQDGRDELFVVNGHIDEKEKVYEMPPQLFVLGKQRWTNAEKIAGEFFAGKRVGRAVAMADYDDDGDFDLAVAHQNSPTALLRNDSARGHWLKLRFRSSVGNRRGIGVRVTVRSQSRTRTQQLCGGTSYLATHQPVLLFGLGEDSGPVDVTVQWPGGGEQTLEQLTVDQSLWIEQPGRPSPKEKPTADGR